MVRTTVPIPYVCMYVVHSSVVCMPYVIVGRYVCSRYVCTTVSCNSMCMAAPRVSNFFSWIEDSQISSRCRSTSDCTGYNWAQSTGQCELTSTLSVNQVPDANFDYYTGKVKANRDSDTYCETTYK